MKIDVEKGHAEYETFGCFEMMINQVDMDHSAIMKSHNLREKTEESFQMLKGKLKEESKNQVDSSYLQTHVLINYTALVIQRVLEYRLSEEGLKLTTQDLVDGLSNVYIDEIDYKVDKLYLISEKLLKSDLNKKVFKFKDNVLFRDIMESQLKKMD